METLSDFDFLRKTMKIERYNADDMINVPLVTQMRLYGET